MEGTTSNIHSQMHYYYTITMMLAIRSRNTHAIQDVLERRG